MRLLDYIVLGLILVCVVLAVIKMRKNRKSGKGCSGCCASCSMNCSKQDDNKKES